MNNEDPNCRAWLQRLYTTNILCYVVVVVFFFVFFVCFFLPGSGNSWPACTDVQPSFGTYCSYNSPVDLSLGVQLLSSSFILYIYFKYVPCIPTVKVKYFYFDRNIVL